jgi:hypothetical protein
MSTPGTDLEPHFRFLTERLAGNYDAYSQYIFTTTATILLIIGWLLTSTDARTYITQCPPVKWVMTSAIAIFLGAEIIFSASAAVTSQRTVGLIEKALNYRDVSHVKDPLIEGGYYELNIIPIHGIVIFVTVHAVLYGVLVFII